MKRTEMPTDIRLMKRNEENVSFCFESERVHNCAVIFLAGK